MNIAGSAAAAGRVAKSVPKSAECKNLVCPHCSKEIVLSIAAAPTVPQVPAVSETPTATTVETKDEQKHAIASAASDSLPEFNYSLLPKNFMINVVAPRESGISFLYRDLLATIGGYYSDIIHLNYHPSSSSTNLEHEYKDETEWLKVIKTLLKIQSLPDSKPVLLIVSNICMIGKTIRNSLLFKGIVCRRRYLKLSIILDHQYIFDIPPWIGCNEDVCWYLGSSYKLASYASKIASHIGGRATLGLAELTKVIDAEFESSGNIVLFNHVPDSSLPHVYRYKPKRHAYPLSGIKLKTDWNEPTDASHPIKETK
jgi:hypothetical protein